MSNLETIRFQKIYIARFSQKDQQDLIKELKRRNISCRLTSTAILFDERYLKDVKDLVPASLR